MLGSAESVPGARGGHVRRRLCGAVRSAVALTPYGPCLGPNALCVTSLNSNNITADGANALAWIMRDYPNLRELACVTESPP